MKNAERPSRVVSAATNVLLTCMGIVLILTPAFPDTGRRVEGAAGVTLAANTKDPRSGNEKDGVRKLWKAYPLAPSKENQAPQAKSSPSPGPSPTSDKASPPPPDPQTAEGGDPDAVGGPAAPGGVPWALPVVVGVGFMMLVGLVLLALRPSTLGSGWTSPWTGGQRKPGTPKHSFPKISVPKVSVPKISVPKMSVPKMSVPKISVPKMSVPKVRLPKVVVPKVGVPKVNLPKVALPRFDRPRPRGPVSRSPLPGRATAGLRVPGSGRDRHGLSRPGTSGLAMVGKALVVALLIAEVGYILFVVIR